MNRFLSICAAVCFVITMVPGDDLKVSPTVMFELGTAYHSAGRVAEAEACYQLVLEFEDHFGHGGPNLPRYKQLASMNMRTIKTNEAIRNNPFFMRGR